MFMHQQHHTDQAVDAAVIPALDLERTGSQATVHSGIRFDSDGDIYAKSAGGSWNRVGTWLLSGTNTDFSVNRTIDSGTLTTDAGSGDLQLNADRTFDVQNSVPASDNTADVTFQIQNWNGGSPNTTYSTRTLRLRAIKE